jgi:hypothetical protein
MTKHSRRRTRRRIQKGGGFSDYFGFGSSEPSVQQPPQSSNEGGWFSGVSNFFSGVGDKGKQGLVNFNQYIGDAAQSGMDTVKSGTNSLIPDLSSSADTNGQNVTVESEKAIIEPIGGRRRKRARSIKGGSNLAYYAAPVSGLKVAEPTSWLFYANGVNQYSVKGGSRKRKGKGRKIRQTHRHRKY